MIDPTKSPSSSRKRYLIAGILSVLIVVAGWVVWTKELHHSSSTSSPPASPASTVPVGTRLHPAQPAPTTTIPGGIALSVRDPFSS